MLTALRSFGDVLEKTLAAASLSHHQYRYKNKLRNFVTFNQLCIPPILVVNANEKVLNVCRINICFLFTDIPNSHLGLMWRSTVVDIDQQNQTKKMIPERMLNVLFNNSRLKCGFIYHF